MSAIMFLCTLYLVVSNQHWGVVKLRVNKNSNNESSSCCCCASVNNNNKPVVTVLVVVVVVEVSADTRVAETLLLS